jgi:tRNA-modifying protein YgfZ
VVAPYEWNGVVGLDLIGEDPVIPPGARACSTEAFESLRVEAGIPEMAAELDERTIAAEADLLDRCVSLTKGCYTGQELVARLDARGNRVARRLRGLVVLDASAVLGCPGDLVGAEVLVGEKRVGSVTSGAWSPSMGTFAAVGYLHRDVVPPCEVRLKVGAGAPDTASGSEVSLRCEARELPMV